MIAIVNILLNIVFWALLICRINEVIVCSWWFIFIPTFLTIIVGFIEGIRKHHAKDKLAKEFAHNIMEKIRRERMN
jgi:hypothetical protein